MRIKNGLVEEVDSVTNGNYLSIADI